VGTEELLPEFHGLMDPSQQDRAKAHILNDKLRKQLAEFRAPQVMMYVKEKILNGELEKTIKMWERKVEIAEVSLLSPGGIEPDLALIMGSPSISGHQHFSSESCSSGLNLRGTLDMWYLCKISAAVSAAQPK
jgi:hypothetical protein